MIIDGKEVSYENFKGVYDEIAIQVAETVLPSQHLFESIEQENDKIKTDIDLTAAIIRLATDLVPTLKIDWESKENEDWEGKENEG